MIPRHLVRPIVIALCVIAALLLAGALIYLLVPATHLPSFWPGHDPTKHTKRGRAIPSNPHTSRGIVLIIAASVPLVAAWWLQFRYEPTD